MLYIDCSGSFGMSGTLARHSQTCTAQLVSHLGTPPQRLAVCYCRSSRCLLHGPTFWPCPKELLMALMMVARTSSIISVCAAADVPSCLGGISHSLQLGSGINADKFRQACIRHWGGTGSLQGVMDPVQTRFFPAGAAHIYFPDRN